MTTQKVAFIYESRAGHPRQLEPTGHIRQRVILGEGMMVGSSASRSSEHPRELMQHQKQKKKMGTVGRSSFESEAILLFTFKVISGEEKETSQLRELI